MTKLVESFAQLVAAGAVHRASAKRLASSIEEFSRRPIEQAPRSRWGRPSKPVSLPFSAHDVLRGDLRNAPDQAQVRDALRRFEDIDADVAVYADSDAHLRSAVQRATAAVNELGLSTKERDSFHAMVQRFETEPHALEGYKTLGPVDSEGRQIVESETNTLHSTVEDWRTAIEQNLRGEASSAAPQNVDRVVRSLPRKWGEPWDIEVRLQRKAGNISKSDSRPILKTHGQLDAAIRELTDIRLAVHEAARRDGEFAHMADELGDASAARRSTAAEEAAALREGWGTAFRDPLETLPD